MVYNWYILPIGGLYATYHLLGEPDIFGQIIFATSHDRFPPKGSCLEGKSPAISGKSRLVKYYNLARYYASHFHGSLRIYYFPFTLAFCFGLLPETKKTATLLFEGGSRTCVYLVIWGSYHTIIYMFHENLRYPPQSYPPQ